MMSANQQLTKNYADRNYKHTTMVRHKGTVVAFAMDDARQIYYTVLNLDQGDSSKGPLDVNYWLENPNPLRFPNEIVQVGYGVAGATRLPIVAKDSHDVFCWHDKQMVVGLEIDRNRIPGMKQNFVVFPQRQVLVVVDGSRNRDNSPCDCWDLGRIRQCDTALGLFLGLVFADQHPKADGFHVF